MKTFRLIIDICLLRGRAQDLPVGMQYVWLSGIASAAIDLLSLPTAGINAGTVVFIAMEAVLFGATLWTLLKLRGVPERWMQAVTALYAANAVFGLMLLPFVPALAEFVRLVQQGANPAPGWEVFVSMFLRGWFLAVMTRVLREATDWSLGLSLVATFACLAFVGIVGALLASALGLQVGV